MKNALVSCFTLVALSWTVGGHAGGFRPSHGADKIVAPTGQISSVYINMPMNGLASVLISRADGQEELWTVEDSTKVDFDIDSYEVSFGGVSEDREIFKGKDKELTRTFTLIVERSQFAGDTPLTLSGKDSAGNEFQASSFDLMGGI